MQNDKQTFWGFFWGIAKSPLAYLHGKPLAQSACASAVNMWCLVLAVLAQFWVFLSFFILLAQTYNTWLVAQKRLSRTKALTIGIGIVTINFAALSLAILRQFGVFISLGLSIWQYVSLIRVCFPKEPNVPH